MMIGYNNKLGVSKNPSTAATNLHGIVHQQMNNFPPQVNESFEMDLIMPPDINSIDSDLSNNSSKIMIIIAR